MYKYIFLSDFILEQFDRFHSNHCDVIQTQANKNSEELIKLLSVLFHSEAQEI